MSDETQIQQSPQPSETASRSRRLSRFAKEHPGTTLIVAAGATGLLAGELAIGALVGVGAALLVTKKSGTDLRQELRGLAASTKGWARKLWSRPGPDQSNVPHDAPTAP